MVDELEFEISESKVGCATVFTIDTEFTLKSCVLTKKYELKVKTDSGTTGITPPLVESGNYISIIYKHTRFCYRVVMLPADTREDIII